MKNRLISTGIVFIIVTAGFIGFIIFEPKVVRADKIWYVGSGAGNDSATIQGGIDIAGAGDTVYVYSGTYNELVTVDKTINLTGENRTNTVIDGLGSGNVVTITADWVNITEFMILHSLPNSNRGLIIKSDNNTIFNNAMFNNDHGILLDSSSNNCLTNNDIMTNNYGIFLSSSSNNNIVNNTIANNVYGIFIKSSTKSFPLSNGFRTYFSL